MDSLNGLFLQSTLKKKLAACALVLTCTAGAWFYLQSSKKVISDGDAKPVNQGTILYLPQDPPTPWPSTVKDDDKPVSPYGVKWNQFFAVPDTPSIEDNKTWDDQSKKSIDKFKEAAKIHSAASFPAVVFIHGFNNTKKAVEKRTDFIDKHIDHSHVITISYDWKSAESLSKYKDDQVRAKHHSKKLGLYFAALLYAMKGTNMTKLYIICHSMGNYILYNFLMDFVNVQGTQFTFKMFHECEVEIIALAADCDRGEYEGLIKDIMNDDNVNKHGIRKWTHYYNKKDEALLFSKLWPKLNTFEHMAGKNAIDDEYKTVTSIDCSDCRDTKWTWNPKTWKWSTGHSYIDRKEIIDDIKKLMAGKSPSERKLKLQNKKKQIYKFRQIDKSWWFV